MGQQPVSCSGHCRPDRYACDPSLLRSETQTLPAAVLPWTATDRGVTWSSSNPEVASVDESGKVTAVGAGQCTVTATSILTPQISSSCTVTVEAYEATPKV